jgi:hypothetical protein
MEDEGEAEVPQRVGVWTESKKKNGATLQKLRGRILSSEVGGGKVMAYEL